MNELCESWIRSATQAGDGDAVWVAQEAREGCLSSMRTIIEFEARDGDPERAQAVAAAQWKKEEYETSWRMEWFHFRSCAISSSLVMEKALHSL